ncbi:hypothetical protein [Shinella zoogloeoides]|uniref:hypothetical protein n=1 Tax=Shinella zoogloeoides TaxID=352475 RepID=UPI000E658B5D|nr:hypothetical protein [Shinella zoogloeoides]WPE22629.1 hypothetical protein ShzoTeo12_38460 [Shinella zoogloeoides]
MTQPASNVIPFPITRTLPVMTAPSLQERAAAFTAAVESAGEHSALSEDCAAHVAAVVRASIRFARRKGVRLDSLPPQLRVWLIDLCNQGDPTCRMIRDWLSGNRLFCASLVKETV